MLLIVKPIAYGESSQMITYMGCSACLRSLYSSKAFPRAVVPNLLGTLAVVCI